MNIYKYITYTLLCTFLMLSTVQTILDMQSAFNIDISQIMFGSVIALTVIPILVMVFIMNMISRKTKNVNMFIVPEVKYIIKTLFYLSVFGVFSVWTIFVISIIGFQFDNLVTISSVPRFIISKLIYSIVYSSIVAMFFNGFTIVNFKKGNKNEV